MTITTSSTTPAAVSSVTVTGTGGGTSHSATYSLTVQSPTPTGCTGYDVVQSGTLAPGGTAYLPYVYDSTPGTMTACLDGPTGADFDLFLQRWNGSYWSTVASATTPSADEKLTYSNTAGYYRLVVDAWSGSGSFITGISG